MKLTSRQYEDIGRIVVHEVLTNRKVNRALSQSPYGMRIALIANSDQYKEEPQSIVKKTFIQKVLSWTGIK